MALISQGTLSSFKAQVPFFTGGSVGNGKAAYAYSNGYVTASGAGLEYVASGLPSGLSINSSNGAITGTPTSNGTYTFTVNARVIGTNIGVSNNYTITINPNTPSISGAPSGSIGTSTDSKTYTISATESATLTMTGSIPGLTQTSTTSSITLTGTLGAPGTYNLTFTAVAPVTGITTTVSTSVTVAEKSVSFLWQGGSGASSGSLTTGGVNYGWVSAYNGDDNTTSTTTKNSINGYNVYRITIPSWVTKINAAAVGSGGFGYFVNYTSTAGGGSGGGGGGLAWGNGLSVSEGDILEITVASGNEVKRDDTGTYGKASLLKVKSGADTGMSGSGYTTTLKKNGSTVLSASSGRHGGLSSGGAGGSATVSSSFSNGRDSNSGGAGGSGGKNYTISGYGVNGGGGGVAGWEATGGRGWGTHMPKTQISRAKADDTTTGGAGAGGGGGWNASGKSDGTTTNRHGFSQQGRGTYLGGYVSGGSTGGSCNFGFNSSSQITELTGSQSDLTPVGSTGGLTAPTVGNPGLGAGGGSGYTYATSGIPSGFGGKPGGVRVLFNYSNKLFPNL